jgi:hypothetical protein
MVTPTDIAVELGRTPSQATDVQWGSWIDQARFLIRSRLGDLSALDQEALDYVTLQAVVRQVRNPEDATQVDVQIDDGRVSKRYSSATGRVSILDEWWALLAPTGANGGAFTITPYSEPDATCSPWGVW